MLQPPGTWRHTTLPWLKVNSYFYTVDRWSLINTSKGSRDIDKSRGVFSSSPYNLITRFGTDHEVFHCQIMGSSTFYCNCNKEGKYWQELLATEVDRCRYFYFVCEMEKFFPRLLLTTSKLCPTRKIITKIDRYFYLVIVLAPVDGGGPGRPVAGRLVLRPQRRSHAAVFSGAGAHTANCLILSFYNLLSQIITTLSHRTQGFLHRKRCYVQI